MSGRVLNKYGRSHTTASYGSSPSPSLYSSFLTSGISQATPYSRPSFPYRRSWTGFNSVVAVHPSQLKRRRERRSFLDDIPEFVKPVEPPPRIRRASSTTWETPKGGDKTFASVVDTPERFRAKIDLGMFEMFERDEIDVNLYGYDIQIYACKDNPRDPNRPARVLNRQYRLPDDVDLQTVRMTRHETRSEVGVDARKIPQDYGRPLTFRVMDVTQNAKKAEQMSGF
ncbi:SHSP domain-containing protein [Aphelenchoides fujianensis]|nr:SHSP domain-containing protein [Aphelenchoides fujianensis]